MADTYPVTSIYPDFNHRAQELAKFIESAGFFTILLKNGEIIHHTPVNKGLFTEWLLYHQIENIKTGGIK